MTTDQEARAAGFHHPYKETCSGYQQGYDDGAAFARAGAKAEIADLEKNLLGEMAGHDVILSNMRKENDKLRAELKRERRLSAGMLESLKKIEAEHVIDMPGMRELQLRELIGAMKYIALRAILEHKARLDVNQHE